LILRTKEKDGSIRDMQTEKILTKVIRKIFKRNTEEVLDICVPVHH